MYYAQQILRRTSMLVFASTKRRLTRKLLSSEFIEHTEAYSDHTGGKNMQALTVFRRLQSGHHSSGVLLLYKSRYDKTMHLFGHYQLSTLGIII